MRLDGTLVRCRIPAVLGATTHAYDGTRRSECTEDWRDVREQLMQQIESLAADAFGQAVL